MIINPSETTNFKSRNAMVRKADQICRFVNTEFTSLSSSKIPARCNFNKNFYPAFKRIHNKITEFVRKPIEQITDNTKEFSILRENVKKYHVANCGELTRLTMAILAVNGIKSIPVEPMLVDKDGRMKRIIDHIMLAIPLNENEVKIDFFSKLKNVLIIDPWLGIADYAPKVEEKYIKDFKKLFQIPNENIDDLKFSIFTDALAMNDFTDKDIMNLKSSFPQYQILNKNK